jgi:hypothetical protein
MAPPPDTNAARAADIPQAVAQGGPGSVRNTPTSTPQASDDIIKEIMKEIGLDKAKLEDFKMGLALGGSDMGGLFGGGEGGGFGDGFSGQGNFGGEMAWMDRASMNFDGGGY